MAILLICEDLDELTILSQALERARLKTMTARSVQQALSLHAEPEASLILLVQYASPIDDVRRLCEAMDALMILITDAVREEEEIALHNEGADIIRFRPYSIRLLTSQTLALLRHVPDSASVASTVLREADIELDSTTRTVLVDNQAPQRLSRLEFRLLHILMSSPGQVLTVDALVQRLWGYDKNAGYLLHNLVWRLRKRVEPDNQCPSYIVTVNEGYMFNRRASLTERQNQEVAS